MRLGTRLAGAEFTFLAGLGAAGGTPNRQRCHRRGLHAWIMQPCPAARCSILTTTFIY